MTSQSARVIQSIEHEAAGMSCNGKMDFLREIEALCSRELERMIDQASTPPKTALARIADGCWRICPTEGFWPEYKRHGKQCAIRIRIALACKNEPLGWVVGQSLLGTFTDSYPVETHFSDLNDALGFALNL